MRIFVTGGSGFVGGHVIEALSARGDDVLAMARSDVSAEVVAGYGAHPVRTDLSSVTAADLDGVDAVVHCAAFVEEWGTRAQFTAGNVDGTRAMLAAAEAAGVRRFVHLGTEAAIFDGRDLIDVDETYPYPARQRYLYSETKAEAERLVLATNSDRMTTLSVRPRFIWGPRDTSVLPAILRMAEAGSFAWIDGGRHVTSTTHVSNVVAAVLCALQRGAGGRAYFVADDGTRTMREVLGSLAATRGVELPSRSVPGWLARPLAAFVEGIWRLFRIRRPPPLTRFAAAMMSRSVTVRTDRARAELGYQPVVSFADGLAGMTSVEPHADARAAGVH